MPHLLLLHGNGLVKNGDLSVTSISTAVLGHVPISSLRLNASLYLYNISITSFFSLSVRHDFSKSTYLCPIFLGLSCIFSHCWGLTIDNFPPVLSVLFLSQCVYEFIEILKKYIFPFKSVIIA